MTESNKMYFETIYEKLRGGDYKVVEAPVPERLPAAFVFDDSKSVNWNRAMLDDADKARLALIAENADARVKKDKAFRMDIIAALKSEYSLTGMQARIVFTHAYRSSHHSGYGEVINVSQSLGMFAEELLGCDQNNKGCGNK